MEGAAGRTIHVPMEPIMLAGNNVQSSSIMVRSTKICRIVSNSNVIQNRTMPIGEGLATDEHDPHY